MAQKLTVVRDQETLARVSSLTSAGSRPGSILAASLASSNRGSRTSEHTFNATLLGAEEAPGPPPVLFSRDNAALVAHYACIGMVNGILQNALQPYCLYVVHGAPNQCSTIATFVNLPWSFKIFYGLLSDSVAIRGQHRKPYIAIGWGLTFVLSLAVAVLGEFGVALPLEVVASVFLAITLAYIVADCAADASMVAFTATEPEATRGSLISTACTLPGGRTTRGCRIHTQTNPIPDPIREQHRVVVGARVPVQRAADAGLLLVWPHHHAAPLDHRGDRWPPDGPDAPPLQGAARSLQGARAAALPRRHTPRMFRDEDGPPPRAVPHRARRVGLIAHPHTALPLPTHAAAAAQVPKPLRARLYQFYELMSQPAAYRVALSTVGLTILSLVTNNAMNNANAAWFHMTPLQFGISSAINNVVLAAGMWSFKRYLLNVNWRLSFGIGIVGMQLLGMAYLLTIYDETFRNGWWIVFTSQDQELAYTLIFAIGVVIIPEIATPGFEGITYGAITTFTNCAQNVSSLPPCDSHGEAFWHSPPTAHRRLAD
eukprot:6435388-Prymnesium_polylepis.2